MTDRELWDYLGNGVRGWGWDISDLKIYDEPRELGEFRRANGDARLRAPQSWCYVRERKE
jgi:hypothetical protein